MNELTQTFAQALIPLLEGVGVPAAEIDAGLEQVRYGVARLALEMGHAESLGLPMGDVVRDEERFPTVRKFHLGVGDFLRLELPQELVALARRMLSAPEPEQFEPIRLSLARAACTANTNTPERALARLLLFEAVRMNLLVATWHDRPDLIRVGLDDDALDDAAEQQLLILVENDDVLHGPEPIRPLHVLVAAGLDRLNKWATQARTELSWVADHVRHELERRARLEEALVDVSGEDALLIKNYFGPAWGEQRLSIERLASYHPLVLGGKKRNTLDQRLKRRLASLSSDARSLPRKKNPTMIDLFSEATGGLE